MKNYILFILFLGFISCNEFDKKFSLNDSLELGQAIDSLHHIKVYYNGSVSNVSGRNTINGYNLGLKYQCVEFVKRYYYIHYHHKMPDSYGHAKSFYNPMVKDGKLNKQRNLIQYSNPSKSRPKVGDLLVMDATTFNKYGHVAIIAKVKNAKIEIIQQNPGPRAASRATFKLNKNKSGKWYIDNKRILGWLRKKI
jgi:surface antigen